MPLNAHMPRATTMTMQQIHHNAHASNPITMPCRSPNTQQHAKIKPKFWQTHPKLHRTCLPRSNQRFHKYNPNLLDKIKPRIPHARFSTLRLKYLRVAGAKYPADNLVVARTNAMLGFVKAQKVQTECEVITLIVLSTWDRKALHSNRGRSSTVMLAGSFAG